MSSQHVNVMRVLMESDGRVRPGTGLLSGLRGVKDRKFSVTLTSAEVTNQSLEVISRVLNWGGGGFKMTAQLKSFI